LNYLHLPLKAALDNREYDDSDESPIFYVVVLVSSHSPEAWIEGMIEIMTQEIFWSSQNQVLLISLNHSQCRVIE